MEAINSDARTFTKTLVASPFSFCAWKGRIAAGFPHRRGEGAGAAVRRVVLKPPPLVVGVLDGEVFREAFALGHELSRGADERLPPLLKRVEA